MTIRIPIEDRDGRTLKLLEGTREEIDYFLSELLKRAKRIRDPQGRELAEDRIIRAMSYLNATPSAEHKTSTAHRRAGGGRLTKGS